MAITALKNIPFKLDRAHLLDTLGIADKQTLAEEFAKLADEAENVGRPGSLFKKTAIEEKGEDYIVLEGTIFVGGILRVNLDKADFVFPALATSGLELEAWAKSKTDALSKFWAESINESVLSIAVSETLNRLGAVHAPGNVSLMTPGSLDDWPLSEQKKLFSLFENSHEEIGVSLSDHFMMRPLKTLSCLVFSSDKPFHSCQLCSRENCPDRRTPFEEGLFEMKYQTAICENSEN